jgi:hypothetical protein
MSGKRGPPVRAGLLLPGSPGHLRCRRLDDSHNPPLATSPPIDDAIRRLIKLSTRIGHIARSSVKPQESTIGRLQGRPSSAAQLPESPVLLLCGRSSAGEVIR